MSDNVKFCIVAALVIGAVLLVGWNQPLRYRFMSKAEIHELEYPTTPEPEPVKPWMWEPRSNKLERPAYQSSQATPRSPYNRYNR